MLELMIRVVVNRWDTRHSSGKDFCTLLSVDRRLYFHVYPNLPRTALL